eukprot:SAG25_NODE_470_length_7663_cov_2.756114_1_plen_77_part_00
MSAAEIFLLKIPDLLFSLGKFTVGHMTLFSLILIGPLSLARVLRRAEQQGMGCSASSRERTRAYGRKLQLRRKGVL